MKQKTLFITGASGMLGVPTVQYFLNKGYSVRALVRVPATYPFAHPALLCIAGDLSSTQALTKGCRGADAIIHFAGRKNDESDSVRVNVRGSALLGTIAQRERVPHFLYMSTASVYLPRKGRYARTKLEGEQAVQRFFPHVSIIRPSVIYSSLQEGIIGSLVRSLRSPLPFTLSLTSAHFYPIHIFDFISALEAILARPPQYCIFDIGGPEALTLPEMHRILRHALSVHTRFIFIRPSTFLPFATLASWCRLPFPFTRSNLLGAEQEITFASQASMRSLGIAPRSFQTGIQELLATSSYRHPEADLFLRYVCPSAARAALSIREYRLFETACRTAKLQPIPSAKLPTPFLLRGLDVLTRLRTPRSNLQQKLLIACALIEMSPLASQKLMRPPHFITYARTYCASGLSLLVALIIALGILCTPGGMKQYGL